jgi:hypothetical protein
MIDDTLGPEQRGAARSVLPSPAILSTSIADILRAPVVRDHATRWAEDLSFLTFDDGSDDNVAADKIALPGEKWIVGRCEICESGKAIPPGHHCDDHTKKRDKIFDKDHDNNEQEEAEAIQEPDHETCAHVKKRSCHNCCHIPLFPNGQEVTQFRIRRLNYNNNVSRRCDHYVAVSYCWSSEQRTQDEIPYQVTEESGAVRKARAPNSVLRRAVAFARQNGLRLIWIDQVRIIPLCHCSIFPNLK